MAEFAGRVVVITGAGSGIGRALAQQFASLGARLALSDIDAATLEQTLALLPRATEARGYLLDVAARDAVFAHAEQVRADFGPVHMLVNNAGVSLLGTFEHLGIEEIEWQLGINLWGVVYASKAFLPGLLAQRGGCIVNIGSAFGFVAMPTQSAYSMSKFAVRALSECLWAELDGTGVEVVSVHPGGVATNLSKLARRAARADATEDRVSSLAQRVLVTPPEQVAAAIVDGLRRGRRRIVVGHLGKTLFWLPRLFPDRYHRAIDWFRR
jgi:short-subunit dehydrogenase